MSKQTDGCSRETHACAGGVRPLRYGSVCSGIEAATVAWEPLGWEPAFFAEIAKFPRAVLQYHYPHVPLHGDFTTIETGQYGTIDLLVGGTPCQSFSIAGLRGGLDDGRGNLALEFLRLAGRLCPRWILWENVPGVLSSNGGRDFGAFLGGLAELGYGFAYRGLDAQFFGLAQRRLRVFVVGYSGDWRRAAAVLFEPESLRGDSPPRRQTRQGIAPTISARPTGGGGLGTDFDLDGGLIAAIQERAYTLEARNQMQAVAFGGVNTAGVTDISAALTAKAGSRQDFESETFIAHALAGDAFDASEDGTGRGTPIVPIAFSCKDHGADAGELAPTLRAMGHQGSHANAGGQLAVALRGRKDGATAELGGDISNAIRASTGGGDKAHVLTHAVRRLTPRECERLQGFPDGYTRIPVRHYAAQRITKLRPADMWEPSPGGGWNLMAADGPRYKGLGNSMAVPVMRRIGERIALMEATIQ